MTAKLTSPVLSATLGLILSLSVGLSVTWKTLNQLVDRAIYDRAHKQPSERQKKGWDFWTVEMENLSSELKDNLAQMRKRSEQLDQREARIVAGEKELGKARADLESMRKQISDRVIEMTADESVNLRKLAATYANLSPTAVVAIVREMDDNTAVKILALMKPDVVGPIFEEMSKSAGSSGPLARRAAILSEKLRLMKVNKAAGSP